MKNIKLNGIELSENESQYLRNLAKKAGISVKKYIEKKGEKELANLIDAHWFSTETFAHSKDEINKSIEDGWTFQVEGSYVSKTQINSFLIEFYIKYAREISEGLMLVFIFKENYTIGVKYLYKIYLQDDSSGKDRKLVYWYKTNEFKV